MFVPKAVMRRPGAGSQGGGALFISDSFLIAAAVCTVVVLVFSAGWPEEAHWFLLPAALCGVVAATDGIEWLRGRLDLLDPAGLIGVLGAYLFFIAPLVQVAVKADIQGWYRPPSDWRPWFGAMAGLNFIGLITYQVVRDHELLPRTAVRSNRWVIDRRRFRTFVTAAVSASAVSQLLVYRHFGGVSGYLDAATDSAQRAQSFRGFGAVFLLSESLPVLAAMSFAVWGAGRPLARRWFVIVLALLALALLSVAFGGLRGSRATVVWALFWAVGLVHLCIRPVPKRTALVAAGCLLLPFMYLYGFLKSGGVDGLSDALRGGSSRAWVEHTSGRSWNTVLLQDMGRSDIQALLLERLAEKGFDHEYALGRTYLASAALLIPQALGWQRPEGKVREATELLFGRHAYEVAGQASSKIYGLGGEAMLNFGPLGVPVVFSVLGILVQAVRRRLDGWQNDARRLLVPFLAAACVIALVGDSDILLFYLIKNGTLPFVVLALSCRTRSPRRGYTPFVTQTAARHRPLPRYCGPEASPR